MAEAGLTVMLVAGEPSGDVLGARLMAALKLRTMGRVRFIGVGGPLMAGQGLASLFPFSELAVVGIAEVLPRLFNLLRRMRQTAALAKRERPDVVVTIDVPGFSFEVAMLLRGAGIPLVHYVAPTVWAWRPGRAKRIARYYDHLLALLPFEPPYFERVGLGASFVGHPVVESGAGRGQGAIFRLRHGIAETTPLLTVLPGSRRGEIARLAEPFGGALAMLKERFPGLTAAVPTVPAVAEQARAVAASWPVPSIVIEDEREKYDAFAASRAALAASGTVALELALARLPAVVAYRINWLTHLIVRAVVKVKYANLVNLILDRPVVPELLQADCVPERLAEAVAALMIEGEERAAQLEVGERMAELLRPGDQPPSLSAADTVLKIAQRSKG
ncbi:MAG: lipid-A-disaccharide synthase [Alphaproteobacteria bacterium]|nr:lipid-A-disaccharide synthase [Alphaproteobacteria bacterium]